MKKTKINGMEKEGSSMRGDNSVISFLKQIGQSHCSPKMSPLQVPGLLEKSMPEGNSQANIGLLDEMKPGLPFPEPDTVHPPFQPTSVNELIRYNASENKPSRQKREENYTIYDLKSLPVLLHVLGTNPPSGAKRKILRFLVTADYTLLFAFEGRPNTMIPAHAEMIKNVAKMQAKCIAAGNISLQQTDGVYTVTKINNKSGDFRPPFDSLKWVLAILLVHEENCLPANFLGETLILGKQGPGGGYETTFKVFKEQLKDELKSHMEFIITSQSKTNNQPAIQGSPLKLGESKLMDRSPSSPAGFHTPKRPTNDSRVAHGDTLGSVDACSPFCARSRFSDLFDPADKPQVLEDGMKCQKTLPFETPKRQRQTQNLFSPGALSSANRFYSTPPAALEGSFCSSEGQGRTGQLSPFSLGAIDN